MCAIRPDFPTGRTSCFVGGRDCFYHTMSVEVNKCHRRSYINHRPSICWVGHSGIACVCVLCPSILSALRFLLMIRRPKLQHCREDDDGLPFDCCFLGTLCRFPGNGMLSARTQLQYELNAVCGLPTTLTLKRILSTLS